MSKYLILFVALLWAATAEAVTYPRDISFSWTNASLYEDGAPIEAGDLTEVRITCLRNGQPAFNVTFPVNGEGLAQVGTAVAVVPSPGQYTCVGVSIIFDGTESVASNEASFKYTGKPLPPVNLQ